ncbi:glutathione S-transferase family protein [Nitratireductor aquimarinus]|uniref:glutathione S-transferase family protein n=1 Tax=Nitratireductor TaxID=245876 RepID=UPI0019D32D3F|nr:MULTISPECIES: glutathione S-transferase family protein [Nitratireductor]MBN7775029.1 glutathione S-transferase family protein [Nitratireductor pacificus]MBN7779890.1 glutathione S-transferase family protein [Nitratireductor pacificus]MBN7788697.1 glutathione S-transferase family protein [Nitratireductor aquimarinus]MBY6097416.1 glutathione S-transferase family protein [Nitratireductor aquimarinus]MCA1260933.1 glutathione S-transferase family protein [Nitratireductor aquimarinus]
MGLLVDGVWRDQWYDTSKTGGRFERSKSQFRDFVTKDGAPAEGRERGFRAEPGRYHLYVSLACPWAHRTLIFRKLKKLEDVISVSVVHHFMGENGWTFLREDGATGDDLYGFDFMHQIYTKADPDYSGRVTVPVLWDKKTETIVSNESAEIIRMLNEAFDEWGDASLNFYPEDLRAEIDATNDLVYDNINNGVYKAGFATTQAAYEEAFKALFDTLDQVEDRLSRQRYLTGSQLTEADWRLFTTLVRFDPVYVGHFKCNLRRIDDYPNLSNYLRELYQAPGVAETVDMLHIKAHYYGSHKTINPTGVVPLGPELNLDAPHNRGEWAKAA